MSVDPLYFGVDGFVFPTPTAAAGTGCDYPAEGDVRLGVSYADGESTGTLVLPAEADVRAGVDYGAAGTEYEGTLSVPADPEGGGALSPADVVCRLLTAAGYVSAPENDPLLSWPGYVNAEPDAPDAAVFFTDTAGTFDNLDMWGQPNNESPGVQVKVRGADFPTAYAKARQLADALDSGATTLTTVYDAADPDSAYLVWKVLRTSAPIRAGADAPGGRRQVVTINCMVSYERADR